MGVCGANGVFGVKDVFGGIMGCFGHKGVFKDERGVWWVKK